MLSKIGNFIWFLLCGLWLGLVWWLLGAIMFIFIITIPWGKAAFMLGKFSFFPFGQTVISRKELKGGEKDIGTGVLGVIGNIIWFIIAGIWLAILNVVWGAVWCVTIIGIPFGMQCFKLAGASLVPIGKTVVKNELAVAAKKQNAEDQLTEMRSKD